MSQPTAVSEIPSSMFFGPPPLLSDFEDGQEGLLWDFDTAHLLHSLFPFFLLLKQLALARNIAAIALRSNIFAQGLHRFSRDDFTADRCLDDDLEHLSMDELFHLLRQLGFPASVDSTQSQEAFEKHCDQFCRRPVLQI